MSVDHLLASVQTYSPAQRQVRRACCATSLTRVLQAIKRDTDILLTEIQSLNCRVAQYGE